ncbi:glycoside hydrolase family 3 N-terminal domain-containing protein [Actinoplanes teichomyceticus]|uniref:Beta-N-acetylhexosaminidase n=1 Tax=Actinoplanes teichomyceticus TaxID=1867 RepID=A0A561VRM4_ACTTI|nr:glycoside hydrolase family 3 N-terminal domain-containing protein [Actinoplanes teichomyceticus]TWG14253.1 beta-N-acetylhexosaminidase [Actinoplanes teichomyceticus]GIF13191.1 hydrolase [Actinoplanes teichomyceticus]
MSKHGELAELAAAVLQPGFVGTSAPDWVRRWLADGLGGVALFARNVESPAQVAALTAQLRAERPDVIVAIDEEAGDVTRFESRLGSSRPGNLALGAIDDVELTEAVARDLGRDLATAGITLDYAPDADVNNNPDNPVIGVRAFGAEPQLVARHTAAFVRGLQAYGVAGCAKHFPGHGDTSVDSHHDVPLIDRTADELHERELVPFRAAIAAGARAVMTGHLLVPACDPDLPATLSPRIIRGLLRDQLGFDGLIVTDAIEMQGVRRRFGLEGATVRALAAGVDAICVGGEHADEQTAFRLRDAIVGAVRAGDLPEQRLRDAVARVRALAAWTTRTQREAGVAHGVPAGPERGSEVGFAAARRAVRVTRAEGVPQLPVAGVPHVVEFAPPRNIAIGSETPWGIGAPLAEMLPGTTSVRFDRDELAELGDPAGVVLAGSAGRPLVLVVRDVHRHPWIEDTLAGVLAARPDAIVVEMGIPIRVLGGVHIATFGATRACGLAAAELIAGAVVPEPVAA